MEKLPFDLDFIVSNFSILGVFRGYKSQSNGNINKTYLLTFENEGKEEKYTLQSINTFVFQKPYELMENIAAVTGHMRSSLLSRGIDPSRRVLSFLKVSDGRYCIEDEEGVFWRVYNYVDGVYTLNSIDKPSVFEATGRAFGDFQNCLADFDGSALHETIENFHNTYHRLEQLKEAIKEDPADRVREVREEIDFIMSREADTRIFTDLISEGKLPVRVTHNDTKLNNVLFDNETNEGICVIDLDTVMPGLSLYDFGDSIRFGANKTIEDDPDISKVGIDLNLFEAYTKGYLSSCGDKLTDKEKELLPVSVKILTLELAIRFLTDYINGDVYFKTLYPAHNLDRCRNQLALVKDTENHMDEMIEITKKHCR